MIAGHCSEADACYGAEDAHYGEAECNGQLNIIKVAQKE